MEITLGFTHGSDETFAHLQFTLITPTEPPYTYFIIVYDIVWIKYINIGLLAAMRGGGCE